MGIETIVIGLVALVVGVAVGVYVGRRMLINQQQQLADSLVVQAERTSKDITTQAQLHAKRTTEESEHKARIKVEEADDTIVRRRKELDREEENLLRRRESLDKRTDEMDKRLERIELRDQTLNKRQSRLDKRENDVLKKEEEKTAELEHIAQMTVEEARTALLAETEVDARNDMARIIRQIEAEAREEADKRAREIISLAVQRLASEHVNEISASVVTLPGEEMKGRIIGRNGRNIRSFEMATGVDVIVDDTPETVTISSFDPIRREVARRTLLKLVTDGRIHPARIEKLVEDTRAEIERNILEDGERAAYEIGAHNLHREVLKLVGRLKYRYSYGQNMYAHAIETANLAGMISAELGADVITAKLGGLLHDIGKAIDHEVEGTHAVIGADFLKRYGVNEKVVNCVAGHHHEVEQKYVEAYIVEAADAISGARPGARRESVEAYIKRVKTLEDIANSQQGVEQSYALQAGREIRILVRPEVIDDLAALELAKNVARQIEESMQYPGQIKVHVIRETRAIDYAK